VARPAIVIALPQAERQPVLDELRAAGFEAIAIGSPNELDALLSARHDIAVAILDGESDLDTSLEYYALLHEGNRKVPVLMVMSPATLGTTFGTSTSDEFFTRPYSADSIRWRIEAMCIRSVTVDDGSGPIIQGGSMDVDDWSRRATVIAVFNP
jgi:DNA-binding response OmpR family regulator